METLRGYGHQKEAVLTIKWQQRPLTPTSPVLAGCHHTARPYEWHRVPEVPGGPTMESSLLMAMARCWASMWGMSFWITWSVMPWGNWWHSSIILREGGRRARLKTLSCHIPKAGVEESRAHPPALDVHRVGRLRLHPHLRHGAAAARSDGVGAGRGARGGTGRLLSRDGGVCGNMGGIERRGQGSRRRAGVGGGEQGLSACRGVGKSLLRDPVWGDGAGLCGARKGHGGLVRLMLSPVTCAVPLVGSHHADRVPRASALGVRQELVRLWGERVTAPGVR